MDRGEISELAALVDEAESILNTLLQARYPAPPGWKPGRIAEWLERAALVQHRSPPPRCKACGALLVSHPNKRCEEFAS